MKKLFVLHPFLFAAYPVFFLFSHNIFQTSYKEVIESLIFIIPFTIMLEVVIFLILKNKRKAAILASFFLFIFFTYGYFHDLVFDFEIAGLPFGQDKYFLSFWFILFVVGIVSILRWKTDFIKITSFLNITAAALYILPIINIASFQINKKDIAYDGLKKYSLSTKVVSKDKLPNIYEIILDGYGSSSTLEDYYNFDNSKFENNLTKLGFHIIPNFRSNYAETRLSFASFLNMRHLYKIGEKLDFQMLENFTQTNAVMGILKSQGYKVVNINSNIGKTQNIKFADINVKCGSFLADEFESILVQTTVLGAFKEQLNLAYFYREKILNALSAITKIHEDVEKPYFVFAHIMPPHPPYVFGPNAEPIYGSLDLTRWGKMWEQKKKYINQVIFVNKEIKDIVSKILSKDSSAIIIIHGDHGPQLITNYDETVTARMKTFFAYHLPPGTDDFLKDTKTLVNVFPSIFNGYFDADIKPLEDESFYTDYSIPYNFKDVTDLITASNHLVKNSP